MKPSQLPDSDQDWDLSALQSSASNKRKRSPAYRGSIRPKRSADRLETINNPPLNNDCVIAFAESAKKKGKGGVWRQVKSERVGHFVEDSVVLAVRFLIAGDGKLEMAGGEEIEAEGD